MRCKHAAELGYRFYFLIIHIRALGNHEITFIETKHTRTPASPAFFASLQALQTDTRSTQREGVILKPRTAVTWPVARFVDVGGERVKWKKTERQKTERQKAGKKGSPLKTPPPSLSDTGSVSGRVKQEYAELGRVAQHDPKTQVTRSITHKSKFRSTTYTDVAELLDLPFFPSLSACRPADVGLAPSAMMMGCEATVLFGISDLGSADKDKVDSSL